MNASDVLPHNFSQQGLPAQQLTSKTHHYTRPAHHRIQARRILYFWLVKAMLIKPEATTNSQESPSVKLKEERMGVRTGVTESGSLSEQATHLIHPLLPVQP